MSVSHWVSLSGRNERDLKRHSQTCLRLPFPTSLLNSTFTYGEFHLTATKYAQTIISYLFIYLFIIAIYSYPITAYWALCKRAKTLIFYRLLVTWCTTSLTFNNCTLCPHCIYVFCIYLRTNSDLCHLHHKLIGFYNRDEKCLQRGTDWVFKYSGLRFGFIRVNIYVLYLSENKQRLVPLIP